MLQDYSYIEVEFELNEVYNNMPLLIENGTDSEEY